MERTPNLPVVVSLPTLLQKLIKCIRMLKYIQELTWLQNKKQTEQKLNFIKEFQSQKQNNKQNICHKMSWWFWENNLAQNEQSLLVKEHQYWQSKMLMVLWCSVSESKVTFFQDAVKKKCQHHKYIVVSGTNKAKFL